jgi:hypothetical protein
MNRDQQETTLNLAGYVPCMPTDVSQLRGVTKGGRFWYSIGDIVPSYPLQRLSRVVRIDWAQRDDREVGMLMQELCP